MEQRHPVFDDKHLISCAGLVPVMALAEQTGLSELIADKVRFKTTRVKSAAANPAGKVGSIAAGLAAGADSIDDLDVIRSGDMKRVFGQVYAPATLGQLLREFTHGHALQLSSVLRGHLYGSSAVVAACVKAGVRFSLVLTKHSSVTQAIQTIDDDAWKPVHYPGPSWTPTPVNSTKKPVTPRLIIRRVRDQANLDELFPVWAAPPVLHQQPRADSIGCYHPSPARHRRNSLR